LLCLTIIKSEPAAFRMNEFPAGTHICGESANPLARFAPNAQGENVHITDYPSMPGADCGGSPAKPGFKAKLPQIPGQPSDALLRSGPFHISLKSYGFMTTDLTV